MDRTTLALLPSESLDTLAPDQSETSERVGGTDVTNQQIDPTVKQEASVSESAPGYPSDTVQSYTEICLAKLSEPQTRSVYGVASDPVMAEPRVTLAEKSLCVYEGRECQTPDKDTSKTSQDVDLKEPQIVAPEINKVPSPNSDSKPCVDEAAIFVDDYKEPGHANNKSPTNYVQLGVASSSPQKQIIPQEPDFSHEEVTLVLFAASISDTSLSELQGSPDIMEDTDNRIMVTEAKCIPEAKSNAVSYSAESSSQSTVFITATRAKTQDGNKTDNICTSALSVRNNEQNAEACPDPQISNPQEDSVFTDMKISEQPNNSEMQIIGTEPEQNGESKSYGSSLKLDVSLRETMDSQLNGSQSAATAQTNKPSRVFISEQKSVLPSGFQDLLRSLSIPVAPKCTLKKRGMWLFN